ncbi:MAG: hypothetical protein CVV25_14450 [Ignavibacteriae bacterium HGW-Ignavibacteriae-4]|jgi:hypothetical protein|nr:MAG: hypothetical protein CVV25_14450 [Ignavibacteriae bacterium HGW-Ignavibacteriae-4]
MKLSGAAVIVFAVSNILAMACIAIAMITHERNLSSGQVLKHKRVVGSAIYFMFLAITFFIFSAILTDNMTVAWLINKISIEGYIGIPVTCIAFYFILMCLITRHN